jgi:hypothetical protein
LRLAALLLIIDVAVVIALAAEHLVHAEAAAALSGLERADEALHALSITTDELPLAVAA